jgi:DNA-binding response OmpR family regulator
MSATDRKIAPPPANGRPQVLVVDDEPSICKALKIALGRAGFDVFTAESGEAAHGILSTRRVDVLIVDLRMPDLRGDVIYHLASALQPQLAGRTVFTSGDHTERAEELVRECGCTLVKKPFELGDIIAAARTVAPAMSQSA